MNLDKNPNYDPQSNPESPGQDCFVRHLRDFRPRRPQLDLEVLEFESPIHSGVPVAVPRSGFCSTDGSRLVRWHVNRSADHILVDGRSTIE